MYSHAHYYLLIDTFVYISRISHTNIFGLFLLYEAKQNWKLVCQHDFPCSRAQVTQIPTVSLLTSPKTSLKQKSRSLHSVQNPLRLHRGSPASFATGSLTTWNESSSIACKTPLWKSFVHSISFLHKAILFFFSVERPPTDPNFWHFQKK